MKMGQSTTALSIIISLALLLLSQLGIWHIHSRLGYHLPQLCEKLGSKWLEPSSCYNQPNCVPTRFGVTFQPSDGIQLDRHLCRTQGCRCQGCKDLRMPWGRSISIKKNAYTTKEIKNIQIRNAFSCSMKDKMVLSGSNMLHFVFLLSHI